jgi:phage shock protein A
MHNKTISKILVAIIMSVMIIGLIPALPVSAVVLSSISPTSGNVGTEVTVIGTIDTLGGGYKIWFDINDNGTPDAGEDIETGNAPANSYNVDDTFTVPPCLGSDAGNAHSVWLQDISTTAVQSLSFAVITSRTITAAPGHFQEGDPVPLNITVTGGTLANTLNNFTVGVTNPAGITHMDYDFSFTTDALGSGSVTKNFPTTFATGASSNWTGTYTVSANRTAPGAITNAASTSFTVGLTDKLTYGRFENVSVKTTGWTPGQNVTITIKDPSDQIVKAWNDVNTTDGTVEGFWIIPWNATMGTYTIEAMNATGNNKAVASMHTFEVGSAALTVTITDNPAASYERTNTVSAMFTIQYPDLSYYTNVTEFSSIAVNAYYNSTLVGTVPLTASNFDSATNKWMVSWKIPRDAMLGSGYKFTLDIDSIIDTNDNHGPTAVVSTTAFTINPATLSVTITKQPDANYTRTEPTTAMMNITYPDNTFYTAADLGSITCSVNQPLGTNIANFTLSASDFNATSNQWTISWTSAFNSTLATDYYLWVNVNNITDAYSNVGPASAVLANAFEMLAVTPTIAMIDTDQSSYSRGEFVQIYFDATYADGSPVTTGTATITVTAPDGFSTTTLNPVHTSNGRWAVTWWASEASQVGAYTVTLGVNGLVDSATPANTGPSAAVTTDFTVLVSDVTLETVMDGIDDLSDRLQDVEADTNALQSAYVSLESAVVSIADLVVELQAQLDACCATSATSAEVAAVESSLESALNQVNSAVAMLRDTAATDADVATVNAAVDAVEASIADVNSAIDQLEAAQNAMNADIANAATTGDVAEVKDDVSDVSGAVGGLNTLVIIAVVLALIAAIAAILAVYIIQRKIAG